MAKTNLLYRLALIVGKLSGNGKYVPAEELVDYVKHQLINRFSDTAGCSQRTLQRDFAEIESLLGIVIRHQKGKGYYIAETGLAEEGFKHLLQNLEILSVVGTDSIIRQYVLPEHNRPVISIDFSTLFDAIKETKYVKFDYTYFRYGGKVSRKEVRPRYLKESQQRWYLVGFDRKDNRLKCFAVERMESLAKLPEKFNAEDDEKIDIPALFRESYGIWNDPATPVEEIVLKYDALDGAFVKSLPLHESQEILEDSDDGITIRLHLRITNDFVMALLSRSRSVEVVAPVHLRDRIRDTLFDAYRRNL